jgi:hypothetical protein
VTGAGVRPVVAGYLAVPAHASAETTQGLVAAWCRSLDAYASREGYCLGPVFTDLRGREERGLYGLADYLRRDGVVGVVVPDVGHLTHVRALSGADRRTVQRFLRSAVLVVNASVAEASSSAIVHSRRS